MIEELIIKAENLKSVLFEEQQGLLHLRSVENFLYHFNELPISLQLRVKKMLEEYFEILDKDDYFLVEKEHSRYLFKTYITPIAHIYRIFLGFRVHMSLGFAFFAGIHLDLILLLFGVLKRTYYLPLCTMGLLSYWLYSKYFLERKRKVYNSGY